MLECCPYAPDSWETVDLGQNFRPLSLADHHAFVSEGRARAAKALPCKLTANLLSEADKSTADHISVPRS